MGRDPSVRIDRSLVWFAHTYLADLNELSRKIEGSPPNSHLKPVGRGLEDQFKVADESVIGDHQVDESHRPLRRIWQDDPRLALTKSLQDQFSVASGHLHVTVLRPRSGVGVLILAAAFDLRELLNSDGILALAASASPTNLTKPDNLGLTPGVDIALDGQTWSSIDDMLKYAAEALLQKDLAAVVGGQTPLEFRIVELRGARFLAGQGEEEEQRICAARELYGILTGDEGWSFVPRERALPVATEGWTSREFLWVTAQRSSVLVVNDKGTASDYNDRADEFFGDWLGVKPEYFRKDFDIAGLDHGVLYAAEKVMAMSVQAEAVSREVQERIRNPTRHRVRTGLRWVRRRILRRHVEQLPLLEIRLPMHDLLVGRLRSTRLRLLACIESVQQTHVAELGRLYDRLCDQTGLLDQTEQLKQYVEMIDNELHEGIKVMLSWAALLVALVAFVISIVH